MCFCDLLWSHIVANSILIQHICVGNPKLVLAPRHIIPKHSSPSCCPQFYTLFSLYQFPSLTFPLRAAIFWSLAVTETCRALIPSSAFFSASSFSLTSDWARSDCRHSRRMDRLVCMCYQPKTLVAGIHTPVLVLIQVHDAISIRFRCDFDAN